MVERTLIIGCGRIGVGRNWIETPHVYTHAGAYRALGNRCLLVGFVDTDKKAANWACEKWGGLAVGWNDLDAALEYLKPNIVSICTPPDQRRMIYTKCVNANVKGVWCEKPWGIPEVGANAAIPVQVNYIRRFDILHKAFRAHPRISEGVLDVLAKRDIHTVCHFTDLALFWGLKKENLVYRDHDGPCSYKLTIPGSAHHDFINGGVGGVFMEAALANLMDAVEFGAELVSPPESANASERWAKEILNESS